MKKGLRKRRALIIESLIIESLIIKSLIIESFINFANKIQKNNLVRYFLEFLSKSQYLIKMMVQLYFLRLFLRRRDHYPLIVKVNIVICVLLNIAYHKLVDAFYSILCSIFARQKYTTKYDDLKIKEIAKVIACPLYLLIYISHMAFVASIKSEPFRIKTCLNSFFANARFWIIRNKVKNNQIKNAASA